MVERKTSGSQSGFLRYYYDRAASLSLLQEPVEFLLYDGTASNDPAVQERVFRNYFAYIFKRDLPVVSFLYSHGAATFV